MCKGCDKESNPPLCGLRRSFTAESFPFDFIDYDGSSQSNEGSLEHFNCNCYWHNGTCPSSDWVIWHPSYQKKVSSTLLFRQCLNNTMAIPIFLLLGVLRIAVLSCYCEIYIRIEVKS